MKKKNIITIIIFNVLALPLFLYAIIMYYICKNTNTVPYLFGQLGIVPLGMTVILGLIIEGVMLFVLAIINKKILIFAPNLILIPVVLYFGFICLFSFHSIHEAEIYKHKETLVVMYVNRLHHGDTYIYKKTSKFRCEYVAQFGIDRCLKYREEYDIYEFDNGIEIKESSYSLFLKYEDGKYFEVETIDEIL